MKFKLFGQPAFKMVRDPKRFRYDSGPFRGKEVVINKEELFDTNIALFNEAGDLTGGLLYAAKKFGLKLDANTLGAMIRLNPVNRLKAIELGVPRGASEALEAGGKRINSQIYQIKRNYPENRQIWDVLDSALYQAKSLNPSSSQNTLKEASKKLIKELNYVKSNPSVSATDKILLNKIIGETDELTKPFASAATRYGDETTYTLQGGKNYRETLFKLDEAIPGNTEPFKAMGHFDDLGKNMVYHVRFDTRMTPAGKKVFMINEIQSDANQAVAKALSKAQQLAGDKRISPYQIDMEMGLLTQSRGALLKQMDEAIKAGNFAKSRAIGKDLKQINQKLKTVFRAADEYDAKKFDYFPMVEADAYGDHALKYLLNKACLLYTSPSPRA